MPEKAAITLFRLSYELAPHFGEHSEKELRKIADVYEEKLKPLARRGLEGISNPEIVRYDKGKVTYLNGDVRVLAKLTAERLGVGATVSKNVSYLGSEGAFWDYLEETIPDRNIRSLVFVGGSYHDVKYSGPSVERADEIARRKMTDHGATIGNISIFHRQDEDVRLYKKTRAGADFFISQLQFELSYTITTIHGYRRLCEAHGIEPKPIYLSFAPLLQDADVERYRKLLRDGEELLPSEVVSAILSDKTAEGRIGRSIANADKILGTTLRRIRNVPLGVNVEQIKEHNLEGASRMAVHFANLLRDMHLAENHACVEGG
ncbi:MAG: hypothetical protein KGH57_03160 [Candidatus Micrarchaeota archaeon]|nr:hypothetical protein [Candidatus Micrarchaeota archaeon]